MKHFPICTLGLLVSDLTFVSRSDTAVVLRVVVGDVGATTQTGVFSVCTNIATHVVAGESIWTITIWTLHVVVTDDLTLGIGGVGGTVIRTLNVAGDLTLGIGGVGGTFIGTLIVTRL